MLESLTSDYVYVYAPSPLPLPLSPPAFASRSLCLCLGVLPLTFNVWGGGKICRDFHGGRVSPRKNLVGGYSFTPPLSMFGGGVKYAAILVGGYTLYMGGYAP